MQGANFNNKRGAFCGSVPTKSELKKSEGYFFKEAQTAPVEATSILKAL